MFAPYLNPQSDRILVGGLSVPALLYTVKSRPGIDRFPDQHLSNLFQT